MAEWYSEIDDVGDHEDSYADAEVDAEVEANHKYVARTTTQSTMLMTRKTLTTQSITLISRTMLTT